MEKLSEYSKVRLALVSEEPLLAYLLYQISVVGVNESNFIAYTNGETIFVSIPNWDKMSLAEKIGTILHELLHIALEHPWLLKECGADPDKVEVFNMVTDIIINKALERHKYQLINECLDKFETLCRECAYLDYEPISQHSSVWFYEEVLKHLPKVKVCQCMGGKSGEGENSSSRNKARNKGDNHGKHSCCRPNSKASSRNAIRGAIKAAISAGIGAGTIGGQLKELIESLERTETNWREILRKWLNIKGSNAWLYSKGKQRDRIIRPKFVPYDHGKADLVVIVDSSGSIDDKTLHKFICEIYTIIKSVGRKVYMVVADAEVHECKLIEREQDIPKEVSGRGGTMFSGAFQVAQQAVKTMIDPVMVVLTDGEIGDLSSLSRPIVPVIWCIVNNDRFVPPFGDIVGIVYK